MARLFSNIYAHFSKHKTQFWIYFIGLFLLVGIGATQIRFENDINKMIPHDPNIEAMNNILNHTKAGEQLVFTLQFKDSNLVSPDSLFLLQQGLEASLSTLQPAYINEINSVQNSEKEQLFATLALDCLPIFLNDEDYKKIDSVCAKEDLQAHFEQLHRLLLSPAGMVAKDFVASDPLSFMPLAFSKLQQLNFDPNYELYNGYIFNKKLNKLTFFVKPHFEAGETGKNKIFLSKLDKIITDFEAQNSQVRVSYFGGVAVAVANASQMQKDTIFTLSLTIILLLSLTYYVFRKKRISLLIIVPVIFGALFGLAMTAILQQNISIIAIGAGAIILGIAVDFSVHFMSYNRNSESIESTVKHLSEPLTLGAITTILAFFALRFANAPLLQDLGTFASFSLMGASIFTLIFLPHISPQPNKVLTYTFIDKMAKWRPEGNKWLVLAVIIATPILWQFSKNVGFESDLMKLNYMSPALEKAQEELNNDNAYALSSLFAITRGASEDEALEKMEKEQATFKKLSDNDDLRKIINPSTVLPSQATQINRIQKWKAYWTPERIQLVQNRIGIASSKVGFSQDAFSGFGEMLSRDYQVLDTASVSFLKSMLPSSFAQKGNDHYAISTLKLSPGKRSVVLQTLESSPDLTLTDKQSVSEKLLTLLQKDFNMLLYVSGAIVFLALLIAYGRIELALISFLPMVISWIWITGLMNLLGLQFNIVNIIIATLLFGLGDDYSIFMMDSLMEKYKTGKNHIRSARSAVYLSVLTTIIGLGTLIFAKHPALRSIAGISIVGLVCTVFISQVLQPFIFNFMIQKRAEKGFMPFTLRSLIRSVIAFSYFAFGGILMGIVGWIIVKGNFFGKKRSKYIFHYILSKYTASVVYVNHKWNQKIEKDDAVDFSKPAVYIANHTSFLDIIFTVMMQPKLVLLTNKWVYNSPIFGALVRVAEYYPVTNGLGDNIEPLQNLVNRGYSIVVFPEGTRSKTDKMGRFHKGAFLIAESLKLDVVPIILHGLHYTIQKGDFLLKKGNMDIKVLAPIPHADRTWGETTKDRTKSISKFFKSEFVKLKTSKETPSYFREQLIAGYIYKGPIVEWYCRIKTKMEHNYENMHQILPREGKFYDLGCGYGFMTHLMNWSSETREMIGVDYDENKIITAAHHYKKSSNVSFIQADLNAFELEACDGIVLSDVLHYMLTEQQNAILERCFEALNPGGKLIIRDGIKELTERHKGTIRTEKWSTDILKFNKTQNDLHFLSRKEMESWAERKEMDFHFSDFTKKTSNVLMVMTKRES